MISLFRYPGGKSKKSVRQKIFAYAPMFYSEFRSAFVGGGGIFWCIDEGIKRWINDLDEDLVAVYEALKSRPDDFISQCRAIKPPEKGEPLAPSKPGGKVIYNARLGEVFNRFAKDPSTDKALRYFFINRTGWSGRVNYEIPSRLYYSNPNGWNIVKKDVLEKCAALMQDVKITNTDYKEVLEAPGDDVWIYLDPPYYVNTELSKTSQLYRHNFTKQDHIDLAESVFSCQHKILMSYDNDDEGFIRSLYENEDGINIYEANWTYCGTSSEKKENGKELIITNYEEI